MKEYNESVDYKAMDFFTKERYIQIHWKWVEYYKTLRVSIDNKRIHFYHDSTRYALNYVNTLFAVSDQDRNDALFLLLLRLLNFECIKSETLDITIGLDKINGNYSSFINDLLALLKGFSYIRILTIVFDGIPDEVIVINESINTAKIEQLEIGASKGHYNQHPVVAFDVCELFYLEQLIVQVKDNKSLEVLLRSKSLKTIELYLSGYNNAEFDIINDALQVIDIYASANYQRAMSFTECFTDAAVIVNGYQLR
ncbi:hypothetical protein AOC36_01865 [Erysipelothrix larvae]|uniref:Uncharacterized protein n=1 Tax=Erysipelothrix larvae TaxID=1514105 RepID=A0A0X8GYV0_9FIRM|nr:hypothetical protein [Erysipelothrix larvae]AMC92774.1 hypothetical protein AOC36_01865 [Erysipelothrix larvae]